VAGTPLLPCSLSQRFHHGQDAVRHQVRGINMKTVCAGLREDELPSAGLGSQGLALCCPVLLVCLGPFSEHRIGNTRSQDHQRGITEGAY
jgi:hypothetical protein